MVEEQQDLPGVRPGPVLPTPSTPSPLLSLPRHSVQRLVALVEVLHRVSRGSRVSLDLDQLLQGLRLGDLQLQLLPAPQPGLPRTCSRLPCFRQWLELGCLEWVLVANQQLHPLLKQSLLLTSLSRWQE